MPFADAKFVGKLIAHFLKKISLLKAKEQEEIFNSWAISKLSHTNYI